MGKALPTPQSRDSGSTINSSGHVSLHNPVLHIMLIIILGLLAYSNTFNVPFQFDDTINIVENHHIKTLSNFWPPSGSRWFGLLTFALNYKIGGLNVIGYHVFNFAIHILNAILVYFLVILTLKTPYFSPPFNFPLAKGGDRGVAPFAIALFSALIFITHPVQTQAVTYIVQRFTSLATFFYLLSLVMYIKWRLLSKQQTNRAADQQGERKNYCTSALLLYCSSIISAILAMKIKEIAFTLPIIIVLYEFMFFKEKIIKKLPYLFPLVVTILIIPLSLINIDKPIMDFKNDVNHVTSASTPDLSRLDYLFTQFRVIVTYIRLLFLPINQNLDYDYPLYNFFLNPNVILSSLFLLAIFSLGVYLLYRSRENQSLRLISFGIFWFFITISVESSIIPIIDVIFEHRVYLPSIGAFIALSTFIFITLNKLKNRWLKIDKTALLILSAIIIVLSGATYARNIVWQSENSLWEDVIKKSPKNARGYNMLGLIYDKNGMSDKALSAFRTSIQLKPDYGNAHTNLGNIYLDKGMFDEALREFQISLSLLTLDSLDTASLCNNIGNLYFKKGLTDKAIEYYQFALKIQPEAIIYFNIGVALKAKGLNGMAIEYFNKAHILNPDRY